MATFNLEVVTPEKMIYSGSVKHVRAPGSEGSFGVLAGHVPFLTSLEVGAIHIDEEDGHSRTMSISGGFAQVSSQGVKVLAETAENSEGIDVERARAAQERAQERLNSDVDGDIIDASRAHAALARALNRLKVSGGD